VAELTVLSRTDQNFCFPKHIGYKPADIISEIDGTTFSSAGRNTANKLTGAFILHPIACGLTFLAGLCAVGGFIGSFIATLIAIAAWVLTLVVLVIDFVVFGVSLKLISLGKSCSLTYVCRSSRTTLTKMDLDQVLYMELAYGRLLQHFFCCSWELSSSSSLAALVAESAADTRLVATNWEHSYRVLHWKLIII
jgi:hypothetical protein